ncbi:MAG: ABC transporter substrate-binding protein [Spirochaetaceae bacterium]|jgi:peptide/nickel transport system substrate-binding protein|nr:ABC transporter substrate-binding protein [Spirochaetaceae bacterium]
MMNKKLSFGLAVTLLAAAASIFAACRKGNQAAAAGETINIGSTNEPTNLSNIEGGSSGITEALSGNIYEQLFRLRDDGKVENLLAESYTKSDDGLTYTITVREGVLFHSGKPFSAADVKSSFERFTAESSLGARKSNFRIVKSVQAPDERTVVFTLNNPSVSFPYTLTYLWIVNTDAPDLRTAEDGTGPYTLESYTRGASLSMVRWDGYWGAPAKNSRVVFHYFNDASAINNALLSGRIDIITTVQNPDALTRFENDSNFVVNNGASTVKELLAFNDRKEPFNNVQVRKAIYSAIDRQKLLNAIWGKYGTLIGSMVPPTDPWYDPALVNANPYNPDLAKTLLDSAGYAGGFAFTLDTPAYDPHPLVAEFIKSELSKLGINVTINPITADEWYSKVFKNRDFAATLQEHVNDRDVVWYGNPDFYWGYNNPEVTKLVSEAERAATEDEQTQKLLEVNRIIANEAASVWLYLYPQIVIAGSSLSGYPLNGLNSQFYAYNIVKK